MSEFHDPELRQQLGRLSGPYPDDNAAFVAWQRRVGQVRRRRAMAWTTGAAMSLIIGVVGVAALQGRQTHSRVPQKSTETSGRVTTTVADTRAKALTNESTVASTTAPTIALAPDTTPTSGAVETSIIAPDEPIATDTGGATPNPAPHKGTGSSGAGGTPSAPAEPNAPTTDSHNSHDVTKKIDSIGGSITVRQDKEKLTVIDVSPATGFQAHQSGYLGQGVDVTFTSATHRSEISVVVDHGKIIPKVTEKNQTHEESVPTTEPTSGGDHSG